MVSHHGRGPARAHSGSRANAGDGAGRVATARARRGIVSLTVRAFRLALRMLPHDLRTLHGDEMALLFEDELARAQSAGPVAVIGLVLHAFGDLARRAPYERWRRRGRPAPQSRGNRMPSFVSDLRFAVRSSLRQP